MFLQAYTLRHSTVAPNHIEPKDTLGNRDNLRETTKRKALAIDYPSDGKKSSVLIILIILFDRYISVLRSVFLFLNQFLLHSRVSYIPKPVGHFILKLLELLLLTKYHALMLKK